MAGKCRAGIVQKAWVLHRCRADDDVPDTVVKAALNGVKVTNTTPELDRNLFTNFVKNGLDRRFVFRLAGEGAIEVDQMQTTRALVDPVPAMAAGSSENTVASSISPCLRRTQ